MALIRIGGGVDGIKEYLETGAKVGRSMSRNDMDERVILAGDLDLTDRIISSMQTTGERYLHMTISFREDNITPEILRQVSADFTGFALAGYQDEEFHLYAEAHLPRIKSYLDEATGKLVVRYPHIHFVLPKINLLSGGGLNPFGFVKHNIEFIDAFQESINAKYGLASPKDNRRIDFTSESTILSRHKGDVFNGQNSDFKNTLLAEVLNKNIETYDRFKLLLKKQGATRTRNLGKANEHEAIKPFSESQFINLRHFIFSKTFIELPTAEKYARLNAEAGLKYESQVSPKAVSENLEAILSDWHDRRCKEIKYLNSGNAKVYQRYQQSTPEQKCNLLAESQAAFYEQYQRGHADNSKDSSTAPQSRSVAIEQRQTSKNDPPPAASADEDGLPCRSQSKAAQPAGPGEILFKGNSSGVTEHDRGESTYLVRRAVKQSNNETGRVDDSVISQLLRDKKEQIEQRTRIQELDFKKIKEDIDAHRVLMSLSHSHGVLVEKYRITKARNGSDRIKCGTKNYNVSDFLTKELHFSWLQASAIMQSVYNKQICLENFVQKRGLPDKGIWAEYQTYLRSNSTKIAHERRMRWEMQRECEKIRLARIKSDFYEKKRELYADKSRTAAERRAAISICIMARVAKEAALRAEKAQERDDIKNEQNGLQIERYRDYLLARAKEDDEQALIELRRQRVEPDAPRYVTAASFGACENSTPKSATKLLDLCGLTYDVDRTGAVTYSRDGRKILTDEGRVLKVLVQDDETIETVIRVAFAKFGRKMTITGNSEFREKVARFVARSGMKIDFGDSYTDNLVQEYRREQLTQLSNERHIEMPTSKIERQLSIFSGKQEPSQENIVPVTRSSTKQTQWIPPTPNR